MLLDTHRPYWPGRRMLPWNWKGSNDANRARVGPLAGPPIEFCLFASSYLRPSGSVRPGFRKSGIACPLEVALLPFVRARIPVRYSEISFDGFHLRTEVKTELDPTRLPIGLVRSPQFRLRGR